MAEIARRKALQLPYLETFAKAAELSSFTAAAKTLGLTQAAISQRIQSLETVLQKPLFHRRGGKVWLSPAGQTLYEHALRIFELHSEARREVSGKLAPSAAELSLAASSIPGEHLLPALLASFRRKYPHIYVRASVGDSMSVIGEVERGQVGLGLVGRLADNPNLEFRRFASDRMVLIVPRRHRLARRRRISIGQLAGYPLIVREAGSGMRHWLEHSLERAGRSLSDLNIALELGSNEAIKEAVAQGVGVAMLSLYAVQQQPGRTLHALAVSGLDCERDMYVVVDRRRVLPIPARQFLAFLESNPLPELRP